MFTLPVFPLARGPLTLLGPFLIYAVWRWILPRLKMRDPARRCRLLWMLAALPLIQIVFVGIRPQSGLGCVLVGIGPFQPAALRHHIFSRENAPPMPPMPDTKTTRWMKRIGFPPPDGPPTAPASVIPPVAPPLFFSVFISLLTMHLLGMARTLFFGLAEYLSAACQILRLPTRREKDVNVLQIPGLAAFTFGLLRPQIYVSAAVWDSPHRDAVLAHERAHRARRDPLIRLIMRSARHLVWYLPFWRRMTAQIEFEAERACDERACQIVPRADYARALLAFVDERACPELPPNALLTRFDSVMGQSENESGLLARVRALSERGPDETPRFFWPLFFVVYFAVAVLI